LTLAVKVKDPALPDSAGKPEAMSELVLAGAKLVPAAMAAIKITASLLGRAFTDSELDSIHKYFRIAIEAEIPMIPSPERDQSAPPRRLIPRRVKRVASRIKWNAAQVFTKSGRKKRREGKEYEDAVDKVAAELTNGFSPAQLPELVAGLKDGSQALLRQDINRQLEGAVRSSQTGRLERSKKTSTTVGICGRRI
jgi:hypothetical protein